MKYVYLSHLLEKNHSIKEELHCHIRLGCAAYKILKHAREQKKDFQTVHHPHNDLHS